MTEHPAELVACSGCRGTGEVHDKETCGATCFDCGGSGRARADSGTAVAECTNCRLRFSRHGDIPDEWQCSCGGLVVELAAKPAELVERVLMAIWNVTPTLTTTEREKVARAAIEAIRPAEAPDWHERPTSPEQEKKL